MHALEEKSWSTLLNPARCGSYMMGAAGLAKNGKFSAWGPGRKTMPKEDADVFIAAMPPERRALYE